MWNWPRIKRRRIWGKRVKKSACERKMGVPTAFGRCRPTPIVRCNDKRDTGLHANRQQRERGKRYQPGSVEMDWSYFLFFLSLILRSACPTATDKERNICSIIFYVKWYPRMKMEIRNCYPLFEVQNFTFFELRLSSVLRMLGRLLLT